MTTDYTRDETDATRYDRHWVELLQELRLAQTGTQILFAFLLAIAFTQPFIDADGFVHTVFSVTLICAGLATCLLIAPVPLHRLLYGRGARPRMLSIASTLTRAGTALLAVAVCGGLLLALDVALTRSWAIALCAVMVAVFVVVWYVIPMLARRER